MLFSAVVTAFNIESYRQLRLDSDEASRALLVTISQQLGNLPQLLSSNFPSNATAQILSQLDALEPATADVWINGLWFASLVCSLIAASLGILVKQWLQRFKTEDYSMARERTRLRQHRFEGLELWGVPRIVACLPLILRTSLNLFFIGLIVFLRNLHLPIAIAISFLISLWFMAYIASLILPSLCSGCPYKSPEATLFYIVRRLHKDGWKSTMENWHFISWADGEEEIKRDVSYDVSTLATVDRIFGDISLDRLVRACLKDLRKEQVIDCVRRIITYRLHTKLGVMAQWKSLDTSRITKKCSESLINILLDTFERLESRITESAILQSTVDYIEQALECVIYLIECVDWGTGAASFDDRLMAILSKLMEIAAPLAGLTASIEKHVITILSNRPVQSHAPTIAGMPPSAEHVPISDAYRCTNSTPEVVFVGGSHVRPEARRRTFSSQSFCHDAFPDDVHQDRSPQHAIITLLPRQLRRRTFLFRPTPRNHRGDAPRCSSASRNLSIQGPGVGSADAWDVGKLTEHGRSVHRESQYGPYDPIIREYRLPYFSNTDAPSRKLNYSVPRNLLIQNCVTTIAYRRSVLDISTTSNSSSNYETRSGCGFDSCIA